MVASVSQAVPFPAASSVDAGKQQVTSEVDPGQTAFLQLLVAQIRHQNPLNPADGVEFLTQLAQFTELEQIMAIRGELEALREQMAAGAAEPAPE
jgi:flagellar basal-body rod modification protein FlgD